MRVLTAPTRVLTRHQASALAERLGSTHVSEDGFAFTYPLIRHRLTPNGRVITSSVTYDTPNRVAVACARQAGKRVGDVRLTLDETHSALVVTGSFLGGSR